MIQTLDPRPERAAWAGLRAPLLALGIAVASLALGGCKASSGPTIDDLIAENQELRDRNQQVEQALNDAESRVASLQAENSDLRAQLAARPAAAPAAQTGFEGLGDVSSRDKNIVVSVAGDVLFASGSADLRADAKRTLDQIASVIQSRYGGSRIEIAGHTDSDPLRKTKSKWQDNENLSAQRALAVERYLATKGISADRMHISGYGPAMPRGSKKDSRRVEIIILGN